MHELSIAEAVIEQVRGHVPAGAKVRSVSIIAGPLRGIEPEAMQWAWRAATEATGMTGAELHIDAQPWRLCCPLCGRTFSADDMFSPCACGCQTPRVIDGDELTLQSIEVDEPAASPS